jgi:methionyl aminopeptidase
MGRVMIVLKSRHEIEIMREANRIAALVIERIKGLIEPGISTLELDRNAEDMITKMGASPAFKGYRGYRHTLCTSINSQVVHGIPSDKVRLAEGDIISIDCGVLYKGYYGDHAWTFPVGEVDERAKKLLKAGETALFEGIGKMFPGNRLYDISAAIEECAEREGFSVVKEYTGHGIGRELHEDPQVPNFGKAGTGPQIRSGLVLAIEPMLNEGESDVKVLEDGWTVVTVDGGRSVHFEHSVAVTDDGPVVLSVL